MLRRLVARAGAAVLLLVAAVAVAVMIVLPGCGGGAAGNDPRAADPRRASAPIATTLQVTETEPPVARPTPPPNGPLQHLGGEVLRRVQLRATPGGRALSTLTARSDMGGPQILALVARRGRWYGVLHPSLPNGRAGWVHTDAVRLVREPWELVVDRSERRLHVRREGREVESFPVAVGRPGSPTPLGRFAVTDRLIPRAGSPYGCCILALSGRQPHLPPGWQGGDRLALHGTSSDLVGGAYSSGCVRIRERDLRRLMDRIPVGTRVTVRA